MTTSGTLGPRALNRPLLSRQLLLERAAIAPVDAIERLVGLQAASILQSTQWGKDLAGADPEEIAAAGRALLDEAPRTRVELGRALARSWPDRDPASLAWAVTYLLPLVQVPPRGLWGARSRRDGRRLRPGRGNPRRMRRQPRSTTSCSATWRRSGPASVADARIWSRLTGLREVVDRLRPRLRRFRDERGRELLDVADGLLPDPETPAPPRFLGEYDNAVLGFEDRSRIVPGPAHPPSPPGSGGAIGDYIVDGMLHGTWRIPASGACLLVQPGRPPAARDADALSDGITLSGSCRLVPEAAADPHVPLERVVSRRRLIHCSRGRERRERCSGTELVQIPSGFRSKPIRHEREEVSTWLLAP